MEVHINGNTQQIPEGCNVRNLIDKLSIAPTGIAVAINGSVVPRTIWENEVLQPKDSITIIKATQGG